MEDTAKEQHRSLRGACRHLRALAPWRISSNGQALAVLDGARA